MVANGRKQTVLIASILIGCNPSSNTSLLCVFTLRVHSKLVIVLNRVVPTAIKQSKIKHMLIENPDIVALTPRLPSAAKTTIRRERELRNDLCQ